MKRFFDAAISAFAILALSPVLAGIAVVVWLESGPPVIFAHERVGMAFRRFRVYKFRTMAVQAGGPEITISGDKRVTRVGRFLRATKMDELPQFWNVLRGDMSIVGPRPEVGEYVERYRARYATVLQVRPGITDPASLRFRNEEELLAQHPDPHAYYADTLLPLKLTLSEAYLTRPSVLADLRIIFQTFVATVNPQTTFSITTKPEELS